MAVDRADPKQRESGPHLRRLFVIPRESKKSCRHLPELRRAACARARCAKLGGMNKVRLISYAIQSAISIVLVGIAA